MKPSWHVVAGVGLGVFMYQVSRNWQLAVTSAATEALWDIDHTIEHLIWSKRPFCLRTFLSSYGTTVWLRMFLIFHSYEFLVLLILLTWYFKISFLWPVILGASVHMLFDEFGNRFPWLSFRLRPGFYFFSYRLLRGFRTSDLILRREKEVTK